jgi:predicted RND superfamily exporter protein
MMISHFEHLVQKEGMKRGLEAAIRGASERLLPILMTALVTALGLLPLAIGSGEAGREIEAPMAIVILGGLLTSTVLNLLVLPALALRFGRAMAGLGELSPVLHAGRLRRIHDVFLLQPANVDTEDKINSFLPALDEMMKGGLVTLEKVRVIHYRADESNMESPKR